MDRPAESQVERRATRMKEMMARLSVDRNAFAASDTGRAYLAARQRCLDCSDVGECIAWLDGRRSGDDAGAFCPNAKLFVIFGKSAVDYQI